MNTQMLEQIIAEMGEALLVADPQGTVQFANRPAALMFGETPENLAGRPVAELLGSVTLPACAIKPIEIKVLRSDGAERTAMLRCVSTPERGLLYLLRDVTRERQFEATLQEGREVLAALAEHVDQQVAVVDRCGRLQEVNHVFAEYVGRRREGIRLLPFTTLVHPGLRPVMAELINREPGNDPIFFSTILQRCDGAPLPTIGHAVPIIRKHNITFPSAAKFVMVMEHDPGIPASQ